MITCSLRLVISFLSLFSLLFPLLSSPLCLSQKVSCKTQTRSKTKRKKNTKNISVTFVFSRQSQSKKSRVDSLLFLYFLNFPKKTKDWGKSRGFLCGRQWRLSHEISADNQLINWIINWLINSLVRQTKKSSVGNVKPPKKKNNALYDGFDP